MVHGYCPYELVFGKIPQGLHTFNTIDRVEPLYNVEDYSKEIKYKLEIAYTRAKTLMNRYKERQKIYYDRNSKNIEVKIGDKILLKNETGHKLDGKYTGPYKVISLKDNGNIEISVKGNKNQIVHKDRIKIYNT